MLWLRGSRLELLALLLSLLLVPLLHLLLGGIISISFRELLMFFLLLLLKLLVLFFLPRVQLFLVLLIFLVGFRISAVRRRGALVRRQLIGMCGIRSRNICSTAACVSRITMHRTSLARLNNTASSQGAESWGGSDGWLAMIR